MGNIRKIIREMIIREAYEHTDDEIVTFNNIDLEYEFDKLNQLLFGGKLERVPLQWNATKGKHGLVSYLRNNRLGTVQSINHLSISKFFKIPYRMFKDTLAHEMIHVKNLQDDIRANARHYKGQAHGMRFIAEMNRINSLGIGFKISVRGEEDYEVSDDIKGKNLYIAVIRLDGNSKSGDFITAMIPKTFQERSKMEKIFNNLITSGKYKTVNIEYYQTNNPAFLKYPAQRKLDRSISYVPASPEDIQKVKNLSTFIERSELHGLTADAQRSYEAEQREKSGFFSQPKKEEPVTNSVFAQKTIEPKVEEPKVEEPKKEELLVSDKLKDQNKEIMAIFKTSTDQGQKEALFNILKTKDENNRDQLIRRYNMKFGRLGFVK